MEIDHVDYKMLEAVQLTALKMMIEYGELTPYLSKQEAYRKYGRSIVDRWFKEGLLTMRKDGTTSAKYRIDRMEIEFVSRMSNRPPYLTVKER